MEDSIHGLPEYLNFHYFFTFSTILAALPMLYMPPTLSVMIYIYRTYYKNRNLPGKMDGNLFLLIILFFICNIGFFLCDYLRLSLPATGIFTSWCASIQPNHYFKVLFMFTFYFNYCVIMILFYTCFVRLIILFFPRNNEKIVRWVMRIGLFLIFTVPIGCTFFMGPALGYCRQMGDPLYFGAIYIYYKGTWFGLRNTPFHLTMSIVMCVFTVATTSLMIYRLRSTMFINISQKTKKAADRAESSLSLTLLATMIPFVNNTILTYVYITTPQYVYYMMILRPFGNDAQAVMIPWLLFFTHPMFKPSHRVQPSATSMVFSRTTIGAVVGGQTTISS